MRLRCNRIAFLSLFLAGACGGSSASPDTGGQAQSDGGPVPSEDAGVAAADSGQTVSTHRDFTSAAELVTIQGYSGAAQDPWITSDEKYLLFDNHSDDPSTQGRLRLNYARKVDYKTFTYVGLVQGTADVGTGQGQPATDTEGNIYFLTDKYAPDPHAVDLITVAHGTFTDGTVTNIGPVVGISKKVAGSGNMGAEPSRDGKYLVFPDNDADSSTIFMATKNADGTFTRLSNAADLMKNVNARGQFGLVNYSPSLSSDNLEIFWDAPPHIYTAKRGSTSEPFGAAQMLTTGGDMELSEGGSLSLDGKRFYYHKLANPSHSDIYVLSRNP